jgi:hypothetical protein
MIAWLEPAALIGLLALAGPLLIHLLRRQRAQRVRFPSLRFVRPTRTAAVRLRVPSDGWLLALRLAIVAAAAIALAQPLVMSSDRQQAWNARLARAVVIDTSASMAPLRGQAAAAAEAEEQAVFRSARVEAAEMAAGLRRAVSALESLPPARQEIVLISDFQRGAVSPSAFAEVPVQIGLRFVAVGQSRDSDGFDGGTLLSAPGVPARTQAIRIGDEGTNLTLNPSPDALAGVRLIATARDTGAADALLRAVARNGAPAPSTAEPLVVVFPGAVPPATATAIGRVWMIRTILRMAGDRDLARAAEEAEAVAIDSIPGATTIIRDRSGAPLVTAAAADGALLLGVAAPPSAFVAAAIVRSALEARDAWGGWGERELARVPAATLSSWSRSPGEVRHTGSPQAAPGDARWLWLAALVLLFLEGIVRRRIVRGSEREVHADAA